MSRYLSTFIYISGFCVASFPGATPGFHREPDDWEQFYQTASFYFLNRFIRLANMFFLVYW